MRVSVYKMQSIQYTVYSIQYTVYSIQYTVYNGFKDYNYNSVYSTCGYDRLVYKQVTMFIERYAMRCDAIHLLVQWVLILCQAYLFFLACLLYLCPLLAWCQCEVGRRATQWGGCRPTTPTRRVENGW
jgi:hypothetical protein